MVVDSVPASLFCTIETITEAVCVCVSIREALGGGGTAEATGCYLCDLFTASSLESYSGLLAGGGWEGEWSDIRFLPEWEPVLCAQHQEARV